MKKEIKKYKWYFGVMLITMLVAIAVEEKNNMVPKYISHKPVFHSKPVEDWVESDNPNKKVYLNHVYNLSHD